MPQQQINEVGMVAKQEHIPIVQDIECTCEIQWYTILMLSLSILGLVIFIFLKSRKLKLFGGHLFSNPVKIRSVFDSGGTMLDGGSLASHSSQHVGRHSSAVSHHKKSHSGCFSRPGAQGSSISAFNLWLLSDVCYAYRGSLPQSIRWWWGQHEHLCQRSTRSVGRNG